MALARPGRKAGGRWPGPLPSLVNYPHSMSQTRYMGCQRGTLVKYVLATFLSQGTSVSTSMLASLSGACL
jgi:hypothetical protein